MSLISISPDSCHSKLVALGEDDVGGGVEPLGDVPHAIGKLQFLDSFLRHMPEYEPIEDGGATPLLILEYKHWKTELSLSNEYCGKGCQKKVQQSKIVFEELD